jgi:hypothetical protein
MRPAVRRETARFLAELAGLMAAVAIVAALLIFAAT